MCDDLLKFSMKIWYFETFQQQPCIFYKERSLPLPFPRGLIPLLANGYDNDQTNAIDISVP